jgi:hypothetical protein
VSFLHHTGNGHRPASTAREPRRVSLDGEVLSRWADQRNQVASIRVTRWPALLLIVPLTMPAGWQTLAFRNIRPHAADFSPAGLTIDVRESAAPIIYPLPERTTVRVLQARGTVTGGLNVSADVQGQPGFDDFALRLGLVEAGGRRPGFFARLFAPAWLRTLFRLAPSGTGIERVRFFAVGTDRAQLGRQRRHPSSELLFETVVAVPDERGRFEMRVPLDPPPEVLAVWVSADGDDTRSTFSVRIEHLALGTP